MYISSEADCNQEYKIYGKHKKRIGEKKETKIIVGQTEKISYRAVFIWS